MDGNHHYDELMRQVKVVKDRVRAVIHGHSNGLYLHGRPGTSKTYMVRSTLDTLAVNYMPHSGHLTPIGLFDLLGENRDRIIVLDDVSAIFNQPIALQLLLAALGNPHDGSGVRHVKHKTASGTRVVPFSGGVICMSNLPLDGHHHEVLAALKDRAFVVNYEPTDDQIIALVYRLAEDGVGGRLAEAMAFLTGLLEDGPKSQQEIKAKAVMAGVAYRTIERAKELLGVESERRGWGPGSVCYWRLPSEDRSGQEHAP
jgi:hypothetical protein